MKLAKIKIDDFGGAPVADHNMPCVACRRKPAVLNLNTGVFEPCWGCQDKGWHTMKLPKFVLKVIQIFETW